MGVVVVVSLLLCSFFSFLFMLFLCNIANFAQRTFEIVLKISREHADVINSVDKNVKHTSTAHMHESREFHVRGTA